MARTADIVVISVCSLLTAWVLAYRSGYDTGKAQVKPCPKVECLTASKVRNIVFQTAKECGK